jgi:hypothetical protein
MTTEQELVPVTQADRDAAADFYGPYLARPGEVLVTAHMRAGKVDESPLVQAFARHRLSSQQDREAVPINQLVSDLEKLRWHAESNFAENHVRIIDAAITALASAPPTADREAVLEREFADLLSAYDTARGSEGHTIAALQLGCFVAMNRAAFAVKSAPPTAGREAKRK